jgi:hypothetical protein
MKKRAKEAKKCPPLPKIIQEALDLSDWLGTHPLKICVYKITPFKRILRTWNDVIVV